MPGYFPQHFFAVRRALPPRRDTVFLTRRHFGGFVESLTQWCPADAARGGPFFFVTPRKKLGTVLEGIF